MYKSIRICKAENGFLVEICEMGEGKKFIAKTEAEVMRQVKDVLPELSEGDDYEESFKEATRGKD